MDPKQFNASCPLGPSKPIPAEFSLLFFTIASFTNTTIDSLDPRCREAVFALRV
jgi:hypothetical protein